MDGVVRLQRFRKSQPLEPFSVTSCTSTDRAVYPSVSYCQPQAFQHQPNEVAPPLASGSLTTLVGGGQSTWQPPDWAIEPRVGVYYHEVLKDGAVICQFNLDKRRHIFGRQLPMCDFVLDHASISRQHAAVVTHQNGRVYSWAGVEMDTTAANLVSSLPSLAPGKAKGPGKVVHSHPSEVSIQYRRGQPVAGPSGKTIIRTTRAQSSSIICAYAAAGQTQTVTQKSPTLTHLPGKQKGPQLADGGGGFPPRDDSGGGGGGGGGENFSGGFFLFGVLAFLGFLKELDVKDDKRDRRK